MGDFFYVEDDVAQMQAAQNNPSVDELLAESIMLQKELEARDAVESTLFGPLDDLLGYVDTIGEAIDLTKAIEQADLQRALTALFAGMIPFASVGSIKDVSKLGRSDNALDAALQLTKEKALRKVEPAGSLGSDAVKISISTTKPEPKIATATFGKK